MIKIIPARRTTIVILPLINSSAALPHVSKGIPGKIKQRGTKSTISPIKIFSKLFAAIQFLGNFVLKELW
jgi:hypothetical protein